MNIEIPLFVLKLGGLFKPRCPDDRMRVRIGNVVIGMNETSNIGSPCAS